MFDRHVNPNRSLSGIRRYAAIRLQAKIVRMRFWVESYGQVVYNFIVRHGDFNFLPTESIGGGPPTIGLILTTIDVKTILEITSIVFDDID